MHQFNLWMNQFDPRTKINLKIRFVNMTTDPVHKFYSVNQWSSSRVNRSGGYFIFRNNDFSFGLFLTQSYCMPSEDAEYSAQDIFTNFGVLFWQDLDDKFTESADLMNESVLYAKESVWSMNKLVQCLNELLRFGNSMNYVHWKEMAQKNDSFINPLPKFNSPIQ